MARRFFDRVLNFHLLRAMVIHAEAGERLREAEDIRQEKSMLPEGQLSRREREVMEIIHRLGSATSADVHAAMEDPPTDAAVRSILRILVKKGHLAFEWDGPRYVYSPTVPARAARRSALENVVRTFFDGSTEGVMTTLLEARGPLTPEEKRRLKELIDRAEVEGR